MKRIKSECRVFPTNGQAQSSLSLTGGRPRPGRGYVAEEYHEGLDQRYQGRRGMTKKNMAIVFGSTNNYFFATGTAILSLLKFSPNLADDIIIYYDRVADRDREILERELGCTLVPYRLPFEFGPDVSDVFARFTPLSLSIYEIFKLLNGYRNVLWLDSDICIQGDISTILDCPGDICIRLGGSRFAKALGCLVHEEIDQKSTNNTGVVLVRDSLPDYNSLHDQCYHYTWHFRKTLNLPDQGILNYVLWKNKIPITGLGSDYNYTVYHDLHSYNRAKIFHVAHDSKFWNHSVMRNLFPLWQGCYDTWLGMGGSAYTGEQRYLDVGSHLSIAKILDRLTEHALELASRALIIQEQSRTIQKLENYIGELLDALKGSRAND